MVTSISYAVSTSLEKGEGDVVKIESKSKTVKLTITWNANGGEFGSKKTVSTTVKKGSKINKFVISPKRDRYTFKGWFNKKTGGTEITKSVIPKKSLTYYAQWTKGSIISKNGKKISIGRHTFKVPKGFKKNPTKQKELYVEFMHSSNKFFRIMDMNSEIELYTFAELIATDLDKEGYRVNINGTPAYKFDTVDITGSKKKTWAYAINIQKDNYVFILTQDIPNQNKFLANIISP